MKNWFIKNWKNCLLILFILMWFGKCTSSCKKSQEIKRQNKEIVERDSIINEKNKIIHDNELNLSWMQMNKEDIVSVANTNQSNYINEITKLREENNSLKNTINSQRIEIKKLENKIKNYNK